MEEEKVISKLWTKNNYFFSISFLILVLALSFWLYFYNLSLEKSITNYKNQIADKQRSIEDIKSDRKFQIYELIQKNNLNIKRIESVSQIPDFISEIKDLSLNYDLAFDGFTYGNWVLSTSITVSENNSLAYQKVSKFIKEYRENLDWKYLFDLWFIDTIVGHDTITTNLKFNLKTNNNK